jgi:hypothetical protein
VLVREREGRRHVARRVRYPVGEAAALEDQQTGAVVGLRLDRERRVAEQLRVRVLAQHGLVPRAERVHRLVRVGEAAPRLGLREVDVDLAALEPDRPEQRAAGRGDLRRQRGDVVPRGDARGALHLIERRREHAGDPGVAQGVLGDPLEPRAGERVQLSHGRPARAGPSARP